MPKFIPLLRRNMLCLGGAGVRDAGLHYLPQRDGCMKSHFQASQPIPALRPSRHPEEPKGVWADSAWAGDAPQSPATQGFRTDPRHI